MSILCDKSLWAQVFFESAVCNNAQYQLDCDGAVYATIFNGCISVNFVLLSQTINWSDN